MRMRTIKYTSQFKRDYKKLKKSGKYKKLDRDLEKTVKLLQNDSNLPKKYLDHALIGQWQDHRDCHIRPDLVLIYRKPESDSLELVRVGSHSELSLY